MALIERLARTVTEHGWIVVVLFVVGTGALGTGLGSLEETSSASGFSEDSDLGAAYDDVRTDFSTRDPEATTMVVAVSHEGGDVLSRDSLLRTLRYQRALRNNETLGATLVDERPTVGIANVVARAAIAADRRQEGGDARPAAGDRGPPTLDEQIARLESMDAAEVEAVLTRVLDPDASGPAGRRAYRLLPRDYRPGSTTATARLIVVTQETEETVRASFGFPERIARGQLAARSLAMEWPGPETYRVVANGLVSHQQSEAISDSLAILGPLAVLFVLVALSVAYRDPVDVLLGLVGVAVVLVWTFGAMGWLGIRFNQVMIAALILLIGLSVDYALHVVVRYREERARGHGVRPAMARSLSGVGPALALVTATTAIGFLANLTSPLGDVRAFGVVTAMGIAATFLVFGLFLPALKTAVASFLARRGLDRAPSPPGSRGTLRRVLAGGAAIARRAPLAVLAVAVLVSAAAVAYGVAAVEVSSSQELFMADEPPAWTEGLPAGFEPGEFFLKENRRYVTSAFQSPSNQGYVLVEGNVTAPGTLDRVAAAGRVLDDSGVAFVGPDGDPEVVTPVTAMAAAAERNRTFNATFHAADGDGDGVPDRNLEAVYDGFYGAAPALAARTVHRTDDGDYAALRLRMAIDGDAERSAAVAALSDAVDEIDGGGLRAVATGQPVIDERGDERISTTVIESLGVTLVVVLALLALAFRLREGSASLGVVTLVPVALTVTWLVGTMAVLEFPVSPVTALVGSIAVGLGVDYAIHVSERFAQERRDGADARTALDRTVTGTGGALASSAVTTAAGFGVLAFSLLPALRQFGLVLAVAIVYAFLATVYVQPSLLVVWERFGGRSVAPAESSTTTGGD